jgi:hypothetical protein
LEDFGVVVDCVCAWDDHLLSGWIGSALVL